MDPDSRSLKKRIRPDGGQQTLAETIPTAITVHRDGEFVYVNAGAVELFGGTDRADLVGRSILDIVHPDDRPVIEGDMGTVQHGDREMIQAERKVQTLDGAVRHVESTVTDIDWNGKRAVISVIHNVTERKDRERKIRQSQAITTDLMTADSTADIAEIAVTAAEEIFGMTLSGIHLLDDSETVLAPVAVTDRVRAHFPGPPSYRQGKPGADELVWEAFEANDRIVLTDITNSERLSADETPVRSGVVYPLGGHGVLLTTSPQVDAFAEMDIDLLGILADAVTVALDRTKHEHHLQEQNERLDQFTKIVSHDLRGPIEAGNGHLALLADAHDLDDDPHVEGLEAVFDRMERLVDDLLSLARSGESVDEFTSVPIGPISMDAWQGIHASGTADLQIECSNDYMIEADRGRLRQLLENLFRNAVEHGGETVTVRVGGLDGGFFVADDGPGIEASLRDEIFEQGFSTGDEGTGFGLAIVDEIVDAHGWDVRVIDGSEGGARFEITGVEVAAE